MNGSKRCKSRALFDHSRDASSETATKFELNNEIESLNKEISDLKKKVLSQNANLLRELAEMDQTTVPQLRRLIYSHGQAALESLARVEEVLRVPPV